MKKYFIIAIMIVTAGLILSISLYYKERASRIRLQDNQATLTNDIEYYRLKDSSLVVYSGVLQMTVGEFKRANDSSFTSIKDRVAEMNIKLRKIESISSAQITTQMEIITDDVRDTIIWDTVVSDTVSGKVWDYTDEFYTVKALEWSDYRYLNIKYRDQMTQVVYREKKGWKFWKRAKLKQVINFKNPDTSIDYPAYIIINH